MQHHKKEGSGTDKTGVPMNLLILSLQLEGMDSLCELSAMVTKCANDTFKWIYDTLLKVYECREDILTYPLHRFR